jgi:hypothetical protein
MKGIKRDNHVVIAICGGDQNGEYSNMYISFVISLLKRMQMRGAAK